MQTAVYEQTHLKDKKAKTAGIQKKDWLEAFSSHSTVFLQTESFGRPPSTKSVYQQGGNTGSVNKNGF